MESSRWRNYSAQEVSSRTLHQRASINPADVYGTDPYETRSNESNESNEDDVKYEKYESMLELIPSIEETIGDARRAIHMHCRVVSQIDSASSCDTCRETRTILRNLALSGVASLTRSAAHLTIMTQSFAEREFSLPSALPHFIPSSTP
jgi:hypothetical protein